MNDLQYIDKELEELKHRWFEARAKGQVVDLKPLLLEQCFFIASLIKDSKTTPFNFIQKYYQKKLLFDIAIDIHNAI